MPFLRRTQSTPSFAPTILLVEDFLPLLRGMQSVLELAHHRVASASSCTEALFLGEGYRASLRLLITRLLLPGTTGPELTKKLRVFIPRIAVLYTSDGSRRWQCDTVRADVLEALLPDPFTDELLLERVASVFRGLT